MVSHNKIMNLSLYLLDTSVNDNFFLIMFSVVKALLSSQGGGGGLIFFQARGRRGWVEGWGAFFRQPGFSCFSLHKI